MFVSNENGLAIKSWMDMERHESMSNKRSVYKCELFDWLESFLASHYFQESLAEQESQWS